MQNDMKYPEHISIIMDGNGRWAAKQGRERLAGHNAGVQSVRDCCEYAVEHGIGYLSLFAFSEENWSRPREEVEGLMKLMLKAVLGERETFRKNDIRFKVIGDRSRLDDGLLANIEMVEKETESHGGLTLIVMLSYSGKWDILQAVSRYADDCLKEGRRVELDENAFSSYLATAGIPDPDLIVRTSGEQRLSNYMLWQAAYTEFYYTSTLWPDFRKKDLDLAVEDFNSRERRFGKVL